MRGCVRLWVFEPRSPLESGFLTWRSHGTFLTWLSPSVSDQDVCRLPVAPDALWLFTFIEHDLWRLINTPIPGYKNLLWAHASGLRVVPILPSKKAQPKVPRMETRP